MEGEKSRNPEVSRQAGMKERKLRKRTFEGA